MSRTALACSLPSPSLAPDLSSARAQRPPSRAPRRQDRLRPRRDDRPLSLVRPDAEREPHVVRVAGGVLRCRPLQDARLDLQLHHVACGERCVLFRQSVHRDRPVDDAQRRRHARAAGVPESPASEAGLSRGDRIVEIGGQTVTALVSSGEIGTAFGASEIGVRDGYRVRESGGRPPRGAPDQTAGHDSDGVVDARLQHRRSPGRLHVLP